jgi:hypothetical protein
VCKNIFFGARNLSEQTGLITCTLMQDVLVQGKKQVYRSIYFC